MRQIDTNQKMSPAARFLIVFSLPLLLALPIGFASTLFLARCGELDSIEKVVAAQTNTGGLYGSAIHPNAYPYKLGIHRARRAEIVAIGSSRVLQFRQAHFTEPFANLGMAANYPAEMEKLVDDILAIHKPAMVILGIDFWWGNPRWVHSPNFDHHKLVGGELTPDALIAPIQWLLDGKVSPQFVLDTLVEKDGGRRGNERMIGVQAILTGNGFGPDGSRYYSDVLYGRRPPEDPRFSDTQRRIATDAGQFKYGSAVMPERIASLRRAIARLQSEGIVVITVLPPVAPAVQGMISAMGERYSYVGEFRARLHDLGSHHFDFHSARDLGSDDCEFVDGFHGGDVVSSRMAKEFGRNPVLAPFIRLEAIEGLVGEYSGMASADTSYARAGEREGDFLQIGCRKGLHRVENAERTKGDG